jgi:hypothetical protein
VQGLQIVAVERTDTKKAKKKNIKKIIGERVRAARKGGGRIAVSKLVYEALRY